MVYVKTVRVQETVLRGIMRRVALGTGVGMYGVARIRPHSAPPGHGIMYPVHGLPCSVCAGFDARLGMAVQAETGKLGNVLDNPVRRRKIPCSCRRCAPPPPVRRCRAKVKGILIDVIARCTGLPVPDSASRVTCGTPVFVLGKGRIIFPVWRCHPRSFQERNAIRLIGTKSRAYSVRIMAGCAETVDGPHYCRGQGG